MPKCFKCGKKSLFLKLDSTGVCSECNLKGTSAAKSVELKLGESENKSKHISFSNAEKTAVSSILSEYSLSILTSRWITSTNEFLRYLHSDNLTKAYIETYISVLESSRAPVIVLMDSANPDFNKGLDSVIDFLFQKINSHSEEISIKGNDNFFDEISYEFLKIAKNHNMVDNIPCVSSVLDAGNPFTYFWLQNDQMDNKNIDIKFFYFMNAIYALNGGAFFANAWCKNPKAFDDEEVFRQSLNTSMNSSIADFSKETVEHLGMELMIKLLEILEPYQADNNMYNNYLHKGLWAMFNIGSGIVFKSLGF